MRPNACLVKVSSARQPRPPGPRDKTASLCARSDRPAAEPTQNPRVAASCGGTDAKSSRPLAMKRHSTIARDPSASMLPLTTARASSHPRQTEVSGRPAPTHVRRCHPRASPRRPVRRYLSHHPARVQSRRRDDAQDTPARPTQDAPKERPCAGVASPRDTRGSPTTPAKLVLHAGGSPGVHHPVLSAISADSPALAFGRG